MFVRQAAAETIVTDGSRYTVPSNSRGKLADGRGNDGGLIVGDKDARVGDGLNLYSRIQSAHLLPSVGEERLHKNLRRIIEYRRIERRHEHMCRYGGTPELVAQIHGRVLEEVANHDRHRHGGGFSTLRIHPAVSLARAEAKGPWTYTDSSNS